MRGMPGGDRLETIGQIEKQRRSNGDRPRGLDPAGVTIGAGAGG
jgi:hypothetical protein